MAMKKRMMRGGKHGASCPIPPNNSITLFEFLKNDSRQQAQLIPNVPIQNGKIELLQKDLGNYNFLYFYIRNNEKVLLTEVVNHSAQPEVADLSLKETRKPGSVFRYERAMDYIQENSEFTIPHVSR